MPDSPDELVVRVPAKINLIIRVLDRLANGYHQLWSIMHTVDLFDVLRIRTNPDHQQIVLQCGNSDLPVDRRNLVYRAADAVLQRAGMEVGVELELTKSIPMAAGLGGGSSDAAGTIWGVSQLLKLGWGLQELKECGATLGSDIPFFFNAPCALVGGWGQEVSPFLVEGERWVVLVNPGFPIQTKWAYDQLAMQRETADPLSEFARAVEAREKISWDDLLPIMENDFEKALFPQYPILGFIKEKLRSLGAHAALLSGSGATVFGIFANKDTARAASATLQQDTQWLIVDVPVGQSGLPHDLSRFH
ncbi:MAG: 4-(cytidine 5'-diphospho)-2-C-methyl-D-erythritol kinase [Nitrospirales bacterium]|nr:4-(cytidine 5'-diphospho)-2-C-methyl-D-erythritol kinase [Nitrospirales bacterium]